ncbi:MAG: hypothetical protein VB084_03185 [Syntrophomonadaceae bacterium]|nr:hypothetical protein [Syntrophomonadaceae bacterium]
MNRMKLKDAEARFLTQCPGGFSDPLMLEMGKKHKVEKMNKLTQESLALEQFENPGRIVESMARIVGQSSMVSVFEKPRFRDFTKVLNSEEKERLSLGLKEFLHGNQGFGFELMCDLLNEYKLAKWTLLTICPVYFRPEAEVFIKPTTTKWIIQHFELEGLTYSPRPTFEFYRAYRDQINRMKAQVGPSLQGNNAAFTGFLYFTYNEDFGHNKIQA